MQDLDDTFKGEEDQFELKDANEDVAEMVKAVNDSLHQVCDFIPVVKFLNCHSQAAFRSKNPVEFNFRHSSLKSEINPEIP